MNNKQFKNQYSKISEALLEFSSPLLKTLPKRATRQDIEQILRITYTVWNAVVFDEVFKHTNYVSDIRATFKHDKEGLSLIDYFISRKNELFGKDLRIIGEYKIIMTDGNKWRLRADARDPL